MEDCLPRPLSELKSVEELAPGVESKALDRQQETPKISPWPNLALEDGNHILGSAKGRYGRSPVADSDAILVVTNSVFTAKPPIPPEPLGRR